MAMILSNNIINNSNSSGIEMVLLWENASPTSKFSPQTINVDLSDYDGVRVVAKSLESSTDPTDRYGSGIIMKGEWGGLIFEHGADGKTVYRTIAVSNDGVEFKALNATYSPYNSLAIPLEIYGIKGVTIA